jgi:hypothetical protein
VNIASFPEISEGVQSGVKMEAMLISSDNCRSCRQTQVQLMLMHHQMDVDPLEENHQVIPDLVKVEKNLTG